MINVFQFSIEHALEIALIFDSNGRITYGNKAAIEHLIYEPDICDYRIDDVFPNLFKIGTDGKLATFYTGEKLREEMAYRGNQTCFPVRLKVLICDESEKKYICLAYDISETQILEKKASQALIETEEALKVKAEFVANVTHELRTPVNGILGNTKELIKIEQEQDKMRLLRLVERGCQDMNGIIDNILDFSKLEAGKFTLEKRKFNIRDMLDYIKSNHMNKITEKGLEFFITISPEVPQYVIGDELRISQILNNLLSNACKFTSVGKIILEVVKTAEFNNRVELFFMVIDSGIGISKVEQDKLFKSFSQVDATISRKYGGTGLGLNICKQLVELMDGNIRVESELGKGSMFSFHIWVDLADGEEAFRNISTDVDLVMHKLRKLTQDSNSQNIFKYGNEENYEEINKKISKLILSMEMENWEKAEMFADAIKQLTDKAPKEIKTVTLKLKMAVQKENYEKAMSVVEVLKKHIETTQNGDII
jgi:signal transduction histidine kinase